MFRVLHFITGKSSFKQGFFSWRKLLRPDYVGGVGGSSDFSRLIASVEPAAEFGRTLSWNKKNSLGQQTSALVANCWLLL
jgi:hypothetical protein